MRSAELTCPLYAATLSDPRRERRPPRGCLQANELALGQAQSERVVHSTALRRHPPRATAGWCPPLRCYRARGRMGARVMASGMPGASRRAVLGGATYSVVKVWIRLSGAGRPRQRHNQRHIPGARPARGCQSWTLCPRVRRHVPLACIGLADGGKAEARAPRGV